MLWFFFCVAVLIIGYFIYGKIIEKIFVINPKRQTPAYQVNDVWTICQCLKRKFG